MFGQTLLPVGNVLPAALFVIRAAVFVNARLLCLFALLPTLTETAGGRDIRAARYSHPNHAEQDADGFKQQGTKGEQYDQSNNDCHFFLLSLSMFIG
nr:MAG TPA: hypothetical protein [Caudoviricetes sp.]